MDGQGRQYFQGSKTESGIIPGTYIEKILKGSSRSAPLLNNHGSSFVDVDGDCAPDLVFDTIDKNKRILDFYTYEPEGGYSRKDDAYLELPSYSGVPVFGDFFGDGTMSIAVPVCTDPTGGDTSTKVLFKEYEVFTGSCKAGSKVYLYKNNQNLELCDSSFITDGGHVCRPQGAICGERAQFSFSLASVTPLHGLRESFVKRGVDRESAKQSSPSAFIPLEFSGMENQPLSLRFGDFDSDSYLDLVTLAHPMIAKAEKPTDLIRTPIPIPVILYSASKGAVQGPASDKTAPTFFNHANRAFYVKIPMELDDDNSKLRNIPTSKSNGLAVSVFDYQEDGTIDLIVSSCIGGVDKDAPFDLLENKLLPIVDRLGLYGGNSITSFPGVDSYQGGALGRDAALVQFFSPRSPSLSSSISSALEQNWVLDLNQLDSSSRTEGEENMFKDVFWDQGRRKKERRLEDNDNSCESLLISGSSDRDAFFLKSTVLQQSDSSAHKCYGQSSIGSTIKLIVTDISGSKSLRIATVRGSTVNNALNTPYALMGLGRTNNYVERFELGMSSAGSRRPLVNGWISLIPNTQVFAFPTPSDEPLKWRLELMVSPASYFWWIVLGTVIVMLIISIVILILDRRETKEDERDQHERFRVHFISA